MAYKGTMNILLVEDNPIHAKLITRALKMNGGAVNVIHVPEGAGAVAYLRGLPPYGDRSHCPRPDIILLDLRMPGIDGLDVLRSVKQDPDLNMIPVTVLSTSHSPADITMSYKRGANAYVRKAMAHHELVTSVRNLCEFWRTTAELPGRA